MYLIMRGPSTQEDNGRHFVIKSCASQKEADEELVRLKKEDWYFSSSYYIAKPQREFE